MRDPRRSWPARRLSAALTAVVFVTTLGCAYRGVVLEEHALEDLVLDRHAVGTDESVRLVASVELLSSGAELRLEELLTTTVRYREEYQARWDEVREAQVKVSVDRWRAFWLLPLTRDYLEEFSANVEHNSSHGAGAAFAIPFGFVLDLLGTPFHLIRMPFSAHDRVRIDAPEERVVAEDTERRSALDERARDYVLHTPLGAKAIPVMSPRGAQIFPLTQLVSLSGAGQSGFTLEAVVDGSSRRVPLSFRDGVVESLRQRVGDTTTRGSTERPARAEVHLTLDRGVLAGSASSLDVMVRNTGEGELRGLVARTVSEEPYLNGRLLHFGEIAPGATARLDLQVLLPSTAEPGERVFGLRFLEANRRAPALLEYALGIGRDSTELGLYGERAVQLPALDLSANATLSELARRLARHAPRGNITLLPLEGDARDTVFAEQFATHLADRLATRTDAITLSVRGSRPAVAPHSVFDPRFDGHALARSFGEQSGRILLVALRQAGEISELVAILLDSSTGTAREFAFRVQLSERDLARVER